jgi:hypothetical protein
MAEAKTQIYYIDMAGTKYAWRSAKDAYKDIEGPLGVKQAKDTDSGLVFGANSMKPVKVRINLANKRSILRFADPGKCEELVVKGSLNGKKYDGQNINSVSLVQG